MSSILNKILEIWELDSIPSPEFLVYLLKEQLKEIKEEGYSPEALEKELSDIIAISIQYLKYIGLDPQEAVIRRLESRHEGNMGSIVRKNLRGWGNEHGRSFYLAHTMDDRHRIRDGIFKTLLEMGLDIRNPFYSQKMVPREDIAKVDKGEMKKWDFRSRNVAFDIVWKDLKKIEESDGLISVMLVPSVGQAMEILWAWFYYKIIYVVTDKLFRHPFVNTFSTKVFKTEEELISFLKKGQGELTT